MSLKESNEAKQKILLSAKKAKWMMENVQKMIEEWHYCVNVSQQVNAIMWILRNLNNMLLENHLKTCAVDKFSSWNKEDIEQFIWELVKVWDISTRK